jgi:7-carboxy-7-deazaguanine synthase
MKVNEIFYSIQGEGVLAGTPTTFVRLAGCNLVNKCLWCDTLYAQGVEDGKDYFYEDIVERVNALTPRRGWVCFTGGEPLRIEGHLYELVTRLNHDYRIEVETNGTIIPPKWAYEVDSWSADVKCPSSGVTEPTCPEWFNMRSQDQLKFVVSDTIDLEFVINTLRRYPDVLPKVLVSPAIPFEGPDMQWTWDVVDFCKRYNLRFSLQLHKILWGNKKGV